MFSSYSKIVHLDDAGHHYVREMKPRWYSYKLWTIRKYPQDLYPQVEVVVRFPACGPWYLDYSVYQCSLSAQ